jgi:superoxide reductase
MIDFNPTSRVPLGRYIPAGGPRLYKCPVCDTVVEILESNGLEITCCGPEMIELREKLCGAHQPHALAIEKGNGLVKVRVGGCGHPMDKEHRIAWIELIGPDQRLRQFLRPGDAPEATFAVDGDGFVARAYCSAHGLWRTGHGRQRKSKALAAEMVA